MSANYYKKNKRKILKALAKKRSQHPEHYRRMERRWREKNRNYWLWYAARTRAKIKGIPFTLKRGDVNIPKFCPVLRVPLISKSNGKHFRNANSPTLDRINPKLGYTKRNVAVICWRANRIKQDETDYKVFLKLANYIRKNINKGRWHRSCKRRRK